MRNRFVAKTYAAGLALAVSLTALPIAAQVAKTAPKAAPRTPDGHPDLQGIYDLATMTPFERLPGDPPVLTKEQAETLQKAEAARRAVNATHLDPNRPPLPVGGDKTQGKSFFEILEKAGGGAVGGYDRLWLNQGTQYMVVDETRFRNIHRDRPAGWQSASRQFGLPPARSRRTRPADVRRRRERDQSGAARPVR